MVRLPFMRSLLILLALLVPSLASAQSSISWFANGAWQPQYREQTPVHLHIQGKKADNSIAYEQDCSPFATCVPAQSSATYAVTLENFDPTREEILAETCNGIVSDPPQQKCLNGPLKVNLKLRLGNLHLTPSFSVGGSPNVQLQGNDGYRLEYEDFPTKFWTAGNGKVPAGKYRITAVNPRASCEIVQANPGVFADITAGDATTDVSIVYTPTTCQLTLKVGATASTGGYVTSSALGSSCASNGTSEVICEATVSYGADLTFTAHPELGSAPFWVGSGGNACAGAGTGATCNFKVRGASVALAHFVAAGDGGVSTSSSGDIDASAPDAGEGASSSSGGTSSTSSSSGSGPSSSSSSGMASSSGNGPGPTAPSSPAGDDDADDDGGCSSAPGTSSSLAVLGTLAWLVLRRRTRAPKPTDS